MLEHSWPGNVRELLNTLRRLAVWSDASIISEQEVREGLLTGPGSLKKADDILGRDIGRGIDLNELIEKVERHYVEKAWLESGGKKKEAAALLGLPNYQTLSKRLKKYGLQ